MSETKYNSDELVPPSFLTETYIVSFLREVEKDPELHLINYETIPGSAAGDHYASVMFKIIATYGTKGRIVDKKRFVLKTTPEVEGDKKAMLDKMPVFQLETTMYQKVLPEMNKILAKHGEKGWWPKLVFVQQSPWVLIFEDLTMDDWKVIYEPLDSDEYSMVVEKIAKYHALSKVLMETLDFTFADIKLEEMPSEDDMAAMFSAMGHIVVLLGKVVSEWKGYEHFAEKLEKYGPRAARVLFQVRSMQFPNEFNVLNHGDFHLRNLMFKTTPEGKKNETLFLDFQAPFLTIPAFDLIGMLTMMCDYEVRKREEEVIKEYHQILVSSLKNYGFLGDLPSIADIRVGFLKMYEYYAFYAVGMSSMFQLRGFSAEEMFSIKEHERMKSALNEVFNKPDFVEHMKATLKRFDNLNAFDQKE